MVRSQGTQTRRVLQASEEAYRHTLHAFLAGTDEKAVTHAYLDRIVQGLSDRRVFLDVGPADGTTTSYLGTFFDDTICVEPSASMRSALRRRCPDARILPEPVLAARPDTAVDLALLSHVLYYVPRTQWAQTVQRILGWLAPGGVMVIVLQDPDNPCMRMVRHFTGGRFDLRELTTELNAAGMPFTAMTWDRIPACYHGADPDEALAVAQFHLSVPASTLPDPDALTDYVYRHFAGPDGDFTIAHDQDVLCVRRRRRRRGEVQWCAGGFS